MPAPYYHYIPLYVVSKLIIINIASVDDDLGVNISLFDNLKFSIPHGI